MKGYKKARFSLHGERFKLEGYKKEDYSYQLNGWFSPYFDFENAMKLLEEYKEDKRLDEGKSYYNQETDTFYIWDSENEYFSKTVGQDITVNGEKIKVYSLCDSWVWCEETNELQAN